MNSYKITPLSKPIHQVIAMPGSKSFTNRALVMAGLTDGQTVLTGVSESDDSWAMVSALKRLGVKIVQKKNQLVIHGNGGKFKPQRCNIDVGPAGTTLRFLAALSSLVPGEIILDGSKRLRERPMAELIEALKSLGADIKYLGKTGCAPIKIKGGRLCWTKVKMSGQVSSQFLTSLFMIAPVLPNGLEIVATGQLTSKSYLDMTLANLKERGIKVKNVANKKLIIKRQDYQPGHYQIEGDASGASYFFALAALTSSAIKIKNLPPDSSQGDVKFCDLLGRMGCRVKKNKKESWIKVEGAGKLKAIKVNMENMPDTAQTLAVIAAFARGTTKITGLSTLKHKETDRLKALKNELAKIDIRAEIDNDFITVHGGQPRGAIIDTYDDHRMAMAFAIAGARIPGLIIKHPEVVSKSFPEFWKILKTMGVKFK